MQASSKAGKAGGMELRVTDLACARGGLPLIEGLSFAVSAGEALIRRANALSPR